MGAMKMLIITLALMQWASFNCEGSPRPPIHCGIACVGPIVDNCTWWTEENCTGVYISPGELGCNCCPECLDPATITDCPDCLVTEPVTESNVDSLFNCLFACPPDNNCPDVDPNDCPGSYIPANTKCNCCAECGSPATEGSVQ